MEAGWGSIKGVPYDLLPLPTPGVPIGNGHFFCLLRAPSIAGHWRWLQALKLQGDGKKWLGTGLWAACLTFDVSMQNPLGVEVFQSLQGLAQVVEGTVFRQTAFLLYELAQ